MRVVIGVIFRKVLEKLQADLLRLIQGQAGVFQQDCIHIRHRQLVRGADLGSVWGEGAHLPQFLVAHVAGQAGAAVEKLLEIDVLRPLIEGGQKLVVDIQSHHVVHGIVVEELFIEIGQLVAGEGADLLRLGPGEGDGADPGDQSQGQEQRRRPGLTPLGDAGDPVLQLPLARRHGGGGQQRGAGPLPHRDQGQQRPAVGDALVLSQGPDGGLVAGQLPVGLGDGGGRPHQGVEPVHRQAHAPQKGPQGVPVPGVGGLMGQHVPQPLR